VLRILKVVVSWVKYIRTLLKQQVNSAELACYQIMNGVCRPSHIKSKPVSHVIPAHDYSSALGFVRTEYPN
jgi:hypothetical protein